jgi:transcriptional regulator with XRE-family HTH domain
MGTQFRERLRGLRVAAGLSQESLAQAAGLSTSGVAKIEQGKVDPTWSTLLRLAQALGVSTGAFAENHGEDAVPAKRPRGRPRKAK